MSTVTTEELEVGYSVKTKYGIFHVTRKYLNVINLEVVDLNGGGARLLGMSDYGLRDMNAEPYDVQEIEHD